MSAFLVPFCNYEYAASWWTPPDTTMSVMFLSACWIITAQCTSLKYIDFMQHQWKTNLCLAFTKSLSHISPKQPLYCLSCASSSSVTVETVTAPAGKFSRLKRPVLLRTPSAEEEKQRGSLERFLTTKHQQMISWTQYCTRLDRMRNAETLSNSWNFALQYCSINKFYHHISSSCHLQICI